jgi:hypothetical protein
MPFRPGQSGNANGRPKGVSQLLTGKIRSMVERDAIEIVKAIIERAKTGDVEACRIFCRYLLPRPKVVSAPFDLPPARTATEAKQQIGRLVSLAAKGELDLDSLHALASALQMAISNRMEELEGILGDFERERERDAA